MENTQLSVNEYHQELLILENVTKIIVELSPALIDAIQKVIDSNRKIESKLDSLNAKADILIVRETLSGFQILEGLRLLTSADMKDRHLVNAEASFLKNISLKTEEIIAERKASYWGGQSYYGLSCVALMRGDEEDAANFLLQAFVLSPKEAREDFGKDLYKKVFEPQCKDIITTYNYKMQMLPDYEKERKDLNRKWWKTTARSAGWLVMGLASQILMDGKQPGGGAMKMANLSTAGRKMRDVDAEGAKIAAELNAIPTKISIENEFEERLNQRCVRIAQDLLAKKK